MRKFFLLAIMVGLLPCSIAAGKESRTGFKFYSDVCLHRETGDLLGTRIGVMTLPDGIYIFFQEAEGQLEEPQTFKLARNALTGSKLSFSLTDSAGQRTFVGTISEAAINGRFTDGGVGPKGNGRYDLKRVALPESGFPECR
jgi:hypothetical protein